MPSFNMINQDTAILWLRKWNYQLAWLENQQFTCLPYRKAGLPNIHPIELLNQNEIEWSLSLPGFFAEHYKYSRRLIRQLLAPLLNCNPLDVPLYSPPHKRPFLYNNHGYISFSHCQDSILLAWSMNPIGVDIENSARLIKAKKIQERFFPQEEQKSLELLEEENLRRAVLKSWVCKEAAIKWQGKKLSTDLSKWYLDINSGKLKKLLNGVTPRWLFIERGTSFCGLVSDSVKSINWH